MFTRAAKAALLPGLLVTVFLIGAFVAPSRPTQFGSLSLAAACHGTFPFCAPPTIASVSPNQGPVGGHTTVTITGTGFFNSPTTIRFGTTVAPITVISDTQLTAVSQAGTVGTVDITATTASGTSATSAADRFRYLPTQPTL